MLKKVRDFHFKQFTVQQGTSTHKVGTDAVLLGAWTSVENADRVLDIGTGTGVIGLMIAQRTEAGVFIDAVELLEEDARQAKKNFESSPWSARMTIHTGAIQNFQSTFLYGLIVSNPPFFVNSWVPPDEKRRQVRHTDMLTFEEIVRVVVRLLNNDGRFSVILPPAEGKKFVQVAAVNGLYCNRLCEFGTRAGKPVERWLMEFGRRAEIPKKEEMFLYNEGNEWSQEYAKLTADFYLKG
jgi:tRNA1Val (adenine37-N6)-methyltransferase